jgi:hypothetical protein
MGKPINLVITDTKNTIIQLLNEMHMPITVMQLVIDNVKSIVDNDARKIVEVDRVKYQESLNKKEENL